MAGRIETYTHSDSVSENKGGSIIKVTCETDFAAKTPEFKAFAKKMARLAYACLSESVGGMVYWSHMVNMFPEIQEEKNELEKLIKENITVCDAKIMVAGDEPWISPEAIMPSMEELDAMATPPVKEWLDDTSWGESQPFAKIVS